MKNSLERFRGRFEQAKERISELEDRMEIMDCKEQKVKFLEARRQWANVCKVLKEKPVNQESSLQQNYPQK